MTSANIIRQLLSGVLECYWEEGAAGVLYPAELWDFFLHECVGHSGRGGGNYGRTDVELTREYGRRSGHGHVGHRILSDVARLALGCVLLIFWYHRLSLLR